MRAITGAVVFSRPCALRKAAKILSRFSESAVSHLPTSDCATYVGVAADAAVDHHTFRCGLGVNLQSGGADDLDLHGYEGLLGVERKHRGGEKDGDTEVPAGGPHGSIEEAELAVAADEKRSKKRKKEEEPHEDKAVAGVASHIPASPEILFESEQRKKKKERHSIKAEDGERERKKKKEKHSDKELACIVKQEQGLVVDEELGSEKKGKKKKVKDHVDLEEDLVDVMGQIVNNGVAEQGDADGEKERKKKEKHLEGGADPKNVKEKMATDSDINSDKKKKKRERGDGDDIQEQGEHKKKKQMKES